MVHGYERGSASGGSRTYRADVDGLRAIAVSMVFLNHANPALLPSGYVGVDIFFVISGFVVTTSILRSGSQSPLRSLLEFWRRRVLRILPALMSCVLVSGVLFSAFFATITQVQFQGTLRTGAAALFGLSNIYLVRIASDYFQADQGSNVFLHTWSLGVEEQFYVLYAMVMFLVLRAKPSKIAFLLLSVLAASSYILFLKESLNHDPAAYFGLQTRLWELMLGALIAVAVDSRRPVLPTKPLLCNAIAFAGIAAIISAAFLDEAHGIAAPISLAAAGSAAIIISGVRSTNVITWVLSLRPTVFVGVLSYSLYLWHWPILVFFRWDLSLGPLQIGVAALLCLAAALASYRFIETPTRHYKGSFLGRVAPAYALALVVAAGAVLAMSRAQGSLYLGSPIKVADWLPPEAASYSPSGSISAVHCRLTAGDKIPGEVPAECFSRTDAKHTVMLIGDSHAFSLFGAIGRLGGEFRGASLVHDGCAIYGALGEPTSSCAKYWQALPALIERTVHKGDFVLFSGFFPYNEYIDADLVAKNLAAVSHAIAQAGATFVIETPHLRFGRPAVFCRREWFRLDYAGCVLPEQELRGIRSRAIAALHEAAEQFPQKPVFWDPLPYLCEDGKCRAVSEDGSPILRDTNHLSAKAAIGLALHLQAFLERMDAQERTNNSEF